MTAMLQWWAITQVLEAIGLTPQAKEQPAKEQQDSKRDNKPVVVLKQKTILYDELFGVNAINLPMASTDGRLRNQTWKRGWSHDYYGFDGAHTSSSTLQYGCSWINKVESNAHTGVLRVRLLEDMLKLNLGPAMVQKPKEFKAFISVENTPMSQTKPEEQYSYNGEFETQLSFSTRLPQVSMQYKLFTKNCLPWAPPQWQPRFPGQFVGEEQRKQVAGGSVSVLYAWPFVTYGGELQIIAKKKKFTQLHTVASFGGQVHPASWCVISGRVDNYGEGLVVANVAVPAIFSMRWLPFVKFIPNASLDRFQGCVTLEANHAPERVGSKSVYAATYEMEHKASTANSLTTIIARLRAKVASDGKIAFQTELSLPDNRLSLAFRVVYVGKTGDVRCGLEISAFK